MTAMQFFCCAAYLGCLLAVGYGAIVWLGESFDNLEIFGLSACIGPAIVGWYLVALSMLGYVPSRQSVIAIGLGAFASIVIYRQRHRRREHLGEQLISSRNVMPDRFDFWWNLIAVIAVCFAATCIIHQALLVTYEWDGYGMWQLKARILAAHPLIPRPDYFFNSNLSFSHLRYPILVSMISAGVSAMVGPTDIFGKTPDILAFLGFAAVLFGAIRRMRGSGIAAAATCSCLLLPDFLNHTGIGTADFLLTALYACSLICLLQWQRHQRFRDLALTAVFSAAMTWTKNEGLPMAAINGFGILFLSSKPFTRRNFAAFALFSGCVAAVYAVWPLYCHGFPRTDEDYASHLTAHEILSHLGRVPHILSEFAHEFVNKRKWSFFWYLLPAIALLNLRTFNQRMVSTLWILLILHFAALVLAYTIAEVTDFERLVYLSIDRLIMHLTPAAALLIALQWPRLKREPAYK